MPYDDLSYHKDSSEIMKEVWARGTKPLGRWPRFRSAREKGRWMKKTECRLIQRRKCRGRIQTYLSTSNDNRAVKCHTYLVQSGTN